MLLAVGLLVSSQQLLAQKYPTRFLGFPIDGPKQTMIENIKSRGYEYHAGEDYFTGIYFGEPVYIFVNTRDGRVNRVLVYDIIQRDSAEIKKRFNDVYIRFKDNKLYTYMSGKKGKISMNENISMGINQYSKNYRAVYGQHRKTSADSMRVQKNAAIPSKYGPIDMRALKDDFRERLRRIHAKALMKSVSTTDDRFMNQVWFAISLKNGKYAMIHCFDNLYNFSQPSDDEEE